MKISVIIPTLNRPDDLKDCLVAIKCNSRQPDEIVIIEQGDMEATQRVVTETGVAGEVFNLAEKSLTKARNLGILKTSGDLVVFVDDDVVISDDYVEIVEQYFLDEKNSSVQGIVGKDLVYAEKKKNWKDYLRQTVGVLFWRSTFSDRSAVLLSGNNTLRNTADKEQVVDWTSGATNCWRRSVFDSFQFDERMIRWCFGEDVTFSHQVAMTFENSLRYVPSLKYRHNISMSQRLLNEQIIKMSIIYRYIFWSEQIKQKSVFASFAYVCSQFGLIALQLTETQSLTKLKFLAQAYWYLLKNRRGIINGEVDFNSFILQQ